LFDVVLRVLDAGGEEQEAKGERGAAEFQGNGGMRFSGMELRRVEPSTNPPC
jgi:hypothetical protein